MADLLAVAFIASAAVAACAGSASEQVAGTHRCDEPTDTPRAATASYEFRVGVDERRTLGPPRSRHAEEVVLGGKRARGPLHLDVTVCHRDSGEPVEASPTMRVTDRSSGAVRALPVAKLTGTGEGRAGIHYGNNLSLPHQASLFVQVYGEHTTLIPPTG